jgi:hypothetical protein
MKALSLPKRREVSTKVRRKNIKERTRRIVDDRSTFLREHDLNLLMKKAPDGREVLDDE